jgi:hypothetical protein
MGSVQRRRLLDHAHFSFEELAELPGNRLHFVAPQPAVLDLRRAGMPPQAPLAAVGIVEQEHVKLFE